ncbi:hypothetical protein PRIC2_004115 [Phytophthora ramorum]
MIVCIPDAHWEWYLSRRLSRILAVMAASFLFASEAFAMTTDSNQAKIAQVTSPKGPSQRLLRMHPTIYAGDNSEERGNTLTLLEKINFKIMRRAGTTADEYAEKLGVAASMRECSVLEGVCSSSN